MKKELLEKQELTKHLGLNIRRFREERGLSMESFAARVSLDYSQLSRIEKGKINTSIYNVFSIARELGVSLCDLIMQGLETHAISDPANSIEK